MFVEAKLLAQLQAAEGMLYSTNNKLHTNVTKRDDGEFSGHGMADNRFDRYD